MLMYIWSNKYVVQALRNIVPAMKKNARNYSNHGPCIAGTEYRAESGGDDAEVNSEDKIFMLRS
jgi:hypothetical protein